MTLVEGGVEGEDRDFVFAFAQLAQQGIKRLTAIAAFGPTLMLPLMSTRTATLTGERRSERSDKTRRTWPLSSTSKSAGVSPGSGRPRLSRTEV